MTCGAYVHIPFCSVKCDYCAFHSITEWTPADQEQIVNKILRDAVTCSALPSFHGHETPLEVTTLYLGGGTPSVLPPGQLRRVVAGMPGNLAGESLAEITCEANPESATPAFLDEAADAGVTRLSIGVQTLHPQVSHTLGRVITSLPALQEIRRRWNGSLGADLIVGIPGQTTGMVLEDLSVLADLSVDHLSLYDLSVEPGTPLERRLAPGRTVGNPKAAAWNRAGGEGHPPGEESTQDWRAIRDAAEAHGFARYEVSNFAKPGHECLHNLVYWRAQPYLGLGPSAVSTLPVAGHTVRLTQPSDHNTFLSSHPFYDAERETLSTDTQQREYAMLGLRTAEGISRSGFAARWDRRLEDLFQVPPNHLVEQGLLTDNGDRLRPTGIGMDLLNQVLLRLGI